MKNLFCTVYDIRRSILFYLTYFCMVGGIASLMTYDGSDLFACPGFIMMLLGMFGFWITFFAAKLFGWMDDAEFLSRKASLWLGLVSAGLLLVLQLYIRVIYGHYGFVTVLSLLPDFKNLLAYHRYLISIRNILVGVMGFSFFSLRFADGDDVGYRYVEVTTHYGLGGMELDKTVSETKQAVGGYILLGLATTVLPFVVSMTPVMLLAFGYFLLRVIKHKSENAAKKKRIIGIVVFSLASAVSLAATFGVRFPVKAMLDYKWNIEDGKIRCLVTDVLNEKAATHITVPAKRFFVDVTYEEDVLDECTNIKVARIPRSMLYQFPSAKKLVITHAGTSGGAAPDHTYESMAATKIVFAYDMEELNCSFYKFDNLQELEIPDSLRSLGTCNFYGIKTTKYKNGQYVGGKENPYLIYVSRIWSDTSLEIHPDTRFVAGEAVDGLEELQTLHLESAKNLIGIGENAFAHCKNLKSVTLPASLDSIEDGAFLGCENLETVSLGSQIRFIGSGVFENCHALEKIVLPATLDTVHFEAWKGCSAKLYYMGTNEQWQKVVIAQKPSDEPFHTPICYSETKAEGCWHYGAEGEILEW